MKAMLYLIPVILLLLACTGGPPAATETPAAGESALLEDTPTATLATSPPVTPPEREPEIEETPTPATAVAATATPLPVSDELSFDFLAQYGGGLKGLAAVGTLAFVGQGPRITAIDVHAPAEPQVIGQSEILPGSVGHLIARGETLHAMAGNHLVQLDVSDPASMKVQASVELPAGAISLILHEDTVYATGHVADYSGGEARLLSYVATLDVAGEPRLLDTMILPYRVNDFALVGGNILYLGAATQPGLGIFEPPFLAIDVDNPAQPGQPQLIENMPQVYAMWAAGNLVLIASDLNTLYAYDASDALSPRQLWQVDDTGVGFADSLAVQGRQIYTVGRHGAGSYAPTRAWLTAPEPLPEPDYLAASTVAFTADAHLVVEQGLLIYSSRDGAELIGRYAPSIVDDLVVAGDILYTLQGGGRFLEGWDPGQVTAYRLPDLAPLAQYTADAGEDVLNLLYGIMADGDRLYLAGHGHQLPLLSQDDLSLLATVVSEETVQYLPQIAWRDKKIPVVDGVAYVPAAVPTGATLAHETIIRLDLSNPQAPRVIDEIPFEPGWQIVASAANEKWLAVLAVADGVRLHLFDLAGESPHEAGVLDAPFWAVKVAVNDNLILIGQRGLQGALAVIDAPTLEILAQVDLPGVYDIETVGDLALVTMEQDARLLAFDLSQPANPRAVAALPLPATAGEITSSGGYVVIGNRAMGLVVLQLNNLLGAIGTERLTWP